MKNKITAETTLKKNWKTGSKLSFASSILFKKLGM
jgi:hypothetical protein